jgi:hypothetical protein
MSEHNGYKRDDAKLLADDLLIRADWLRRKASELSESAKQLRHEAEARDRERAALERRASAVEADLIDRATAVARRLGVRVTDLSFSIGAEAVRPYTMMSGRIGLDRRRLVFGAALDYHPEPKPSPVVVTEDDGELDFEFSPDDRIGLTPIPPEVEAELAGLRVDGLSDDELSESAAFEAIHDLISLEAAEAWRAKGSPMRPGAKPGAIAAIESVGQPLNGHPMAAHAVAELVDDEGYTPASALSAMREAAAAQAFGTQNSVIS